MNDLSVYFKSVLEQDTSAVVICNLQHEIIYMNPAAKRQYARRGGKKLLGKSLLACHNENSCARIVQILEWFAADPSHNILFTAHNNRQNKDVYIVALRDEDSNLIGYYEKHLFRKTETAAPYDFSK